MDHSKLVCNSGVAYCLAAHSTLEGEGQSDVNVFEESLHYVQDIPINKGNIARVFWDNGSNRVLVNNHFARENKLKSCDAVVTLKVVDEGYKTVHTKIYELDLCDMYGLSHPVWGYGVDNILDPEDPVDLQRAKSLFPHIPEQAFIPLPKRRIDILVGINYNALHPSGGLGVDSVGNLKALRSRFGCGWVIGGSCSDTKPPSVKFSVQAAAARFARLKVVPSVYSEDLLQENFDYVTASHIKIDSELTPSFGECEGMGVLPSRKCDSFNDCALEGPCSEAHLLHN